MLELKIDYYYSDNNADNNNKNNSEDVVWNPSDEDEVDVLCVYEGSEDNKDCMLKFWEYQRIVSQ